MIGNIFYLMFVFWPYNITGLGPPSLLFSGTRALKQLQCESDQSNPSSA